MAVTIQIKVFWPVTPCSVVIGYKPCCPDDGGSKVLWNVCLWLQHYSVTTQKTLDLKTAHKIT